MIIRRNSKATDEGAQVYSFRVSLSASDVKKWLRESYLSHCFTGTDGQPHLSSLYNVELYNTADYLKSQIESAVSWLPSYKREPVISWAYSVALEKGYIVQDGGRAYIDFSAVNVKPGPVSQEG